MNHRFSAPLELSPRLLFLAFVGVIIFAAPSAGQSGGAPAAIARFTGTWKEDVTKRKIGSLPNLRFAVTGNGQLQEARGPEARPVLQPVIFDSKPHEIEGGNRISWKQLDSQTFERLLLDGRTGTGRVVTTRRIRLSPDGKTLTEATERRSTDGRTSVETLVYQRISDGPQGLVGRWKPQSFKTTATPLVRYEPVGIDGLKSFFYEAESSYMLVLDGNPVPVVGPSVIIGTMMAAKATDDRTIEFTSSRGGAPNEKSVGVVSADGKTLTITSTEFGPNASPEPSVTVYRKQ